MCCFLISHLKKHQKITSLNFLLQELCGFCCSLSQLQYLKLLFEETIKIRWFKCIHWLLSVRGVSQKMQVGNCIKLLSVRSVDCVVDWNNFSCDKSHIYVTLLVEENSADRLTYITDGLTNIEVREERKPYLAVGYYML